jgi:predicted nucleotidyltransferase/DNA-binding MarR family transcriptional regulator
VPVDIDRFEAADDLGDPPTSKRVIRFLFANAEHAYTRGEIADAIDADPETVGTNLTRLKDRGLVRHREPYWAVTDDSDHAFHALRVIYDRTFASDLVGLDPDSGVAARDDGSATDRTEPDATTTDRTDRTSGTAERFQPQHRAAATEFFDRVRNRVADDIVGLHLFGSVARGGATADSDVDVLVVIADDADYATVDEQLLDTAYEVQLEYGVRIEVHSLRASEFVARKDRGDPFVRTVLETGESHG